ncbi:MAG: HEPN domain-containing protein [bacterium]
MIFLDIEFKPVHDLGYLLNLIGTKDDSLEAYFGKVDEISRYAVQIRYPDAIIQLTKQQIQEAIEIADDLFGSINLKIAK